MQSIIPEGIPDPTAAPDDLKDPIEIHVPEGENLIGKIRGVRGGVKVGENYFYRKIKVHRIAYYSTPKRFRIVRDGRDHYFATWKKAISFIDNLIDGEPLVFAVHLLSCKDELFRKVKVPLIVWKRLSELSHQLDGIRKYGHRDTTRSSSPSVTVGDIIHFPDEGKIRYFRINQFGYSELTAEMYEEYKQVPHGERFFWGADAPEVKASTPPSSAKIPESSVESPTSQLPPETSIPSSSSPAGEPTSQLPPE